MLPASEGQDAISYDAFRAKMEHEEQQLKRRGLIPIRVLIDAATLKGWVEANSLTVCRASIGEFIQICGTLILERRGTTN